MPILIPGQHVALPVEPPDPPPEGFAYFVDQQGAYFINEHGAYYITEIA